MPSSPSEFLDELNKRVDPEAILGLVLREGQETTRMGRSIKAHCPVHGSGNFKSLHVDLNLGTCRCVVRECRASHAMSLLEFYALCEDLPIPAAVIKLCRQLELPVPESYMDNLRGRTWSDFEMARREKRHDDAIKSLPILAMFDDLRLRVPVWRAELELAKAGGSNAREHWVTAADEFLKMEEWGEAVGILERLHEETPEDIEILTRLGETQRRRHPRSSTWGATYFQRAKLLIDAGRNDDALVVIGEAMEVLSKSAEMRETHGNLLLSMGREQDAKPEIWTAAFLYEQQGQEEQAIPLLEKVIELDPDDTQSREKVAEFRIRLGDLGSYLRYMEDLANLARERNDWANAELYARKILGRNRENAVAQEILAAVHERKEQKNQAARHLLVAARARYRLGEKDTAKGHLDRASELGLEGTDAQAELAETLIVFGDRVEGISILQRTAASLLELDLAIEATPLLMRIADLAPDPSEFAASAAELSESMEVSDLLTMWERAAFSHLESGNVEQALSLARLGGETLSKTAAAGLLQLRVYKEAGLESEAVEVLEGAVAEAMAREDPATVLELLREGCEAIPQSARLLEKLARMTFSNGAREESLTVWKKLIRLPDLKADERLEHAAQAVALPGGGPPFKLLEGLAHWRNGTLEAAASVYTDLCGDLLQKDGVKGRKPFKVDASVLDEYLDFLRDLKGHSRGDMYVRLANMMEAALSDGWARLEKLCTILAELSSPAESLTIASRFVEGSLADDRPEEAHRAIQHILSNLAPEDPQWREMNATVLARLGRAEESRKEWLALVSGDEGAEGMPVVRRALEHLPGDRHLQRALLEQLLVADEMDEALELADELIAHHRVNDEPDTALEIARKVLDVAPENLPLRLDLARSLAAGGNRGEALAEYRRVANEAREETPQIAREAMEAIVETDREDAETLGALVRVIDDLEGVVAARTYRHRLYELMVAGCQDDTYLTPEVNTRMVEVINADPDDHELRDHHVTYLGSRGRHLDAALVLLDYSKTLLGMERLEESLAALERALGHAPTSLEILLELATRLEQAGKNARAVEEWRRVLGLATEAGDTAASQHAWGRIVRLLPGKPEILYEYGCFLDEIEESDEALRIYRQAVEFHLSEAAYNEAVPILQRMLEMDPDDCGTRGQLADCLLATGRKEEATGERLQIVEKLLERGDLAWASKVALQAREEAPESTRTRELVAAVHTKAGKVDEATEECRELVELMLKEDDREKAVELLRKVVDDLMELKQYTAIRTLLEPFADLVEGDARLVHGHALALESTDKEEAAGEKWLHLAGMMWDEGEGEQAEKHLRRAIALNPQDRTARFLLVEIMEKRGGTREALIQEYHDLAKLARSEGNTAEAISLLDKLLEIEPRDVVALRRLAKLLAESERAGEALQRYLELGAAHVELGDLDAARRAYSSAVLLDPLDSRPTEGLYKIAGKIGDEEEEVRQGSHLAEILKQTGNDDKALEILEELADRCPGFPDVRLRLANHYETTEQFDLAIGHLRKLFTILHESRDFPGAIDALNRIESIDPNDPENLAQTGRLYAKMRDNAQAVDYFLMAARGHRDRDDGPRAMEIASEGLGHDPWNEDLLQFHATMARTLGKVEIAQGSLEKLVELAGREQNPEKEITAISHLADLRPEDEKLRERLALLYSDLDMSVEAAEQFLLLSALQESRGNTAEALDAASTASTIAPDLPAPHERLAILHGKLGQAARASEESLWLANYYEEADQPKAALNALEAIPENLRNSVMLLRTARLSETCGRGEDALDLYRQIASSDDDPQLLEALEGILRLEPTDLDVHTRLDKELREKGHVDDAQRVSFDLFENLLTRGEVDLARQVVAAAQPHATDQFQFLRDTATLYEDHGLPELAAIALRTLAEQLVGERPEHALELMDRSLTLKPWDVASKELRFTLLEKLHQVDALAEAGGDLITVRVSRMDLEGACDIARRVIRVDDEALEPRLRLVELLDRLNENEERSALLQEIADLYLKKGKIEEALDVLRTLIRIHPDNTLFRRRFIDTYRQVGPESDLVNEYIPLAKTLAKNGKSHEAIKVFERLLSFAGENLPVHQEFINFLFEASQLERAVSQSQIYAAKLLEADKAKESIAVLERIRKDGEDDPQFHTLLGKAQLACKARGAGVRELRKAAVLYRESGQHSSEADILALVCSEDSYNLEARQLLVEALISAGRTSEASAASLDLVNTYKQRGLPDLAVGEYRRLLALEPDKPEVWKELFETAEQLGVDDGIIEDYIEYADMLARRGDTEEAVNCYRRAIGHDPRNIRAHRGFVVQYQKVGSEREILEEMMTFAELLVEEGEPDEAVKYFEHVMTLDPQNTRARVMLDATKSSTSSQIDSKGVGKRRSPSATQAIRKGYLDDELGLTDTQKRFIYQTSSSASDATEEPAAADASQEVPGADDTLDQAVLNYRNILAVNAGNANVRLKLADVLGQMGKEEEMVAEMVEAANTFLKKSQLEECVDTCNRILKIVPSNHHIRRLLNEAEIKRDAMKALDSTISFLKLESREEREQ